MKRTKRIASVLLALVMALSLITTAFAAGENGSITIDNAVVGKTYTIYRIFDLNSHNNDYTAINYKVSTKWAAFFQDGAKGHDYVTIDDQGYVTWKASANQVAFAADAYAFAQAEHIADDGKKTADSSTVKFENLTLGYYLVQSDLGVLCSLDTTMPDVTIKEKNSKPTVDKQVQENSNSNWGDTNDANIGDTVNFKTTINVVDGQPKNYVLHDKMSNGLTFDAGSVEVKIGDRTLTLGSDYTLIANPKDGCTFEIEFKENVLKPNDVVIVTYSATLNEKAVIYPEPNTNETKLVYGEGSETTWDETKTFTYQFDLVKTKTDNTVLNGAEFKLYDAKTEGNEIALIDEGNGVYRVATAAEKAAEGFVSATIKAGKVTIKGLDSGTYYLEETKAPAGYNVLAERVEVKIDHANLTATVEGGTYVSGGVQVINQTGAELPSTGGIGTTIFYVVGGLLVVAAGVLLVTRKRMSKSED
jgi:fimbrial isopeptide formation D2 family protein/LPXTG-motif cell wall-anchored protein